MKTAFAWLAEYTVPLFARGVVMQEVVAVGLLFLPLQGLYAATDYQCVSDCTQKGYMYQYCTSRCFYNDSPYPRQDAAPRQRPRQTDFQCVSDCTNRGYMYQYCQERCSY